MVRGSSARLLVVAASVLVSHSGAFLRPTSTVKARLPQHVLMMDREEEMVDNYADANYDESAEESAWEPPEFEANRAKARARKERFSPMDKQGERRGRARAEA